MRRVTETRAEIAEGTYFITTAGASLERNLIKDFGIALNKKLGEQTEIKEIRARIEDMNGIM